MRPLVDVLILLLDLYKWIVIISIVFSWLYAFNVVNTRNQAVSMIGDAIYRLTEPVYRPIRRIMPNLGPVDLSSLVVLLAIYVLQSYLIQYVRPYVP